MSILDDVRRELDGFKPRVDAEELLTWLRYDFSSIEKHVMEQMTAELDKQIMNALLTGHHVSYDIETRRD